MQCVAPEPDHVPGRLRLGLCERHYRRFLKTGTTAAPARIDDLTRFAVQPDGCWLWAGAVWPNGYGKTARVIHGTRIAHRVIYMASGREIPDGLDLDHLCRVRQCVNPDHLEPVSRAVNITRGHEARETCKGGHDLTDPANVKPGTNQCIPCWRIRYKAAGARYRAKQKGYSLAACASSAFAWPFRSLICVSRSPIRFLMLAWCAVAFRWWCAAAAWWWTGPAFAFAAAA